MYNNVACLRKRIVFSPHFSFALAGGRSGELPRVFSYLHIDHHTPAPGPALQVVMMKPREFRDTATPAPYI